MIHYSCDRCRCKLASDDLRYVVKIEIQAAMDPACEHEPDEDRDHLVEIEDILESTPVRPPNLTEAMFGRHRRGGCGPSRGAAG